MSEDAGETDRREAAMDDLRATSDSIRADVHQLEAVEDQKSALQPGDDSLRPLSTMAVELAERIEHEAKAERQIAREMD
jgi:hypothetical protein